MSFHHEKGVGSDGRAKCHFQMDQNIQEQALEPYLLQYLEDTLCPGKFPCSHYFSLLHAVLLASTDDCSLLPSVFPTFLPSSFPYSFPSSLLSPSFIYHLILSLPLFSSSLPSFSSISWRFISLRFACLRFIYFFSLEAITQHYPSEAQLFHIWTEAFNFMYASGSFMISQHHEEVVKGRREDLTGGGRVLELVPGYSGPFGGDTLLCFLSSMAWAAISPHPFLMMQWHLQNQNPIEKYN